MKIMIVTFLCLVFTSCAVQSIPEATPESKKIKVVENADSCRVLDIVIGSSDVGSQVGLALELAMIDAKNKAARLGADSIRVVGPEDVAERESLSNPESTVIVEALDCK